jgi:release factor glutamine methyltransferase
MIYEPQEDSYLLEKHVKIRAKGKVLDLGTGSGIQARAALTKTEEVLAADINPESIKHCKELNVKTIESNLFSNIKEKFNLIIFNPPYLPEDEEEPEDSKLITTGGKKGHEVLEEFLIQAKNHLEEKGEILTVVSNLTGDVEGLFNKYNYKFKKLDSEKLFFEELFVYSLSLIN